MEGPDPLLVAVSGTSDAKQETAAAFIGKNVSDAPLTKCRREALTIVIAMLVCAVLLATAMRHASKPVYQATRNPWTLLVITMLVIFALFFLQKSNPSLCLILITIWGAFLFNCAPVVSPDGTVDYSDLSRVFLNMILILLLAVIGGYVTDFYASWGVFLFFMLLALLIVCITFFVIPPSSVSPVAYNIFSAAGSLLFAIWTVKDVRECAGNNPTEAAITIFIDLVNLLQFSY